PQIAVARKETRRSAMSDRIHELLNRNLQEVFGEGNAARRRAAIEELYTDDCVLYVPPGVFVGHDALDKFAGDLRATHPHFAYTPHGEPQAVHNAGRLAWGSGPRGEKPDYTGLDGIIVRGDKIAALYVFLDVGNISERDDTTGECSCRSVHHISSRTVFVTKISAGLASASVKVSWVEARLVTGDRERCDGAEQNPAKMLAPCAPGITDRAEDKQAGKR